MHAHFNVTSTYQRHIHLSVSFWNPLWASWHLYFHFRLASSLKFLIGRNNNKWKNKNKEFLKNLNKNHQLIQHQQYNEQDQQVAGFFIPLDTLPVLLSEGLSEVAPSFSLSAESSDSFRPVCLTTTEHFLKWVSKYLNYLRLHFNRPFENIPLQTKQYHPQLAQLLLTSCCEKRRAS